MWCCVKDLQGWWKKKPREAVPGGWGCREGYRGASDKLPWTQNCRSCSWPLCDTWLLLFLVLMISTDTLWKLSWWKLSSLDKDSPPSWQSSRSRRCASEETVTDFPEIYLRCKTAAKSRKRFVILNLGWTFAMLEKLSLIIRDQKTCKWSLPWSFPAPPYQRWQEIGQKRSMKRNLWKVINEKRFREISGILTCFFSMFNADEISENF